MARLCERCQYYTPGNDELTCPECRIPLRFTLLPPEPEGNGGTTFTATSTTGVVSTPVAALPTRQGFRARRALEKSDNFVEWCLNHRKILLPLFGVLVILFGVGGYSSRRGAPLTERYEQIQVGMEEDEVLDILDSGGTWSSWTSDFYEIADEADDTRYTWVWEEDGAKITIEIADGKVVRKSMEELKDEEPEEEPEEPEED